MDLRAEREDEENEQKYPDYTEEEGLADMMQHVLKENHDPPTAGHLGGRKTIAKVVARNMLGG